MIVLDASAVLELLLHTSGGRKIAARISPIEVTLHAPFLMDLEVTQAVRRFVRQGTLTEERGGLAIAHLRVLDVRLYPHTPLLPRIWALRDNLTAYDAAYVALAEVLEAPLLTFDERLAGAPKLGIRVEIPE